MSRPAIRVENLSKAYRIGLKEEIPDTITGALTGWIKSPLTNYKRLRRLNTYGDDNDGEDTLWALKDVSFDVQEGEVLGVIGRNGAGKSTLLKILSRITEPTSGRVRLRGRVSSLLEVGTGFHPELTGRENVYMNGTILGMTKKEIDRKFDEIVEFSGVEKFLDTPVKRYSSGMKVRLAFAVAAHLEPEILIIDEVLAVGDAEFQKKCIGKMRSVGTSGRTVLFVSHNMAAVEALCTSCVLMREGTVAMAGSLERILSSYLLTHAAAVSSSVDLVAHPGRTSESLPYMKGLSLFSANVPVETALRPTDSLTVSVTYSSSTELKPILGMVVKTTLGIPVFGVNNRVIPGYVFVDAPRSGVISVHIDKLSLSPGTYLIDLYLGSGQSDIDVIQEATAFEVCESDVFGSGRLPPLMAGPMLQTASWTLD